MTDSEDWLDQKLGELARRTEALHVSAGFSARVADAIESDAPMPQELLRSARRLLPVALVVAVLGLGIAVSSEQSTDQAFAVADDVVEIEW